MRRVNPRTQTPVSATILILVVGVVLMVALPGDALLQLIVGGTILPALVYGAIVVLYLVVRGGWSAGRAAFDLGRFELPVAVAALIWVAVAVFVLVTPADAFVPTLIVLGIVATGGHLLRLDDDLQPRGARGRAGRRRRGRGGAGDDEWGLRVVVVADVVDRRGGGGSRVGAALVVGVERRPPRRRARCRSPRAAR